MSGQLDGPSSYLMKSPYRQRPDDVARADIEQFIQRNAARTTGKGAPKPAGEKAAGKGPGAKSKK